MQSSVFNPCIIQFPFAVLALISAATLLCPLHSLDRENQPRPLFLQIIPVIAKCNSFAAAFAGSCQKGKSVKKDCIYEMILCVGSLKTLNLEIVKVGNCVVLPLSTPRQLSKQQIAAQGKASTECWRTLKYQGRCAWYQQFASIFTKPTFFLRCPKLTRRSCVKQLGIPWHLQKII